MSGLDFDALQRRMVNTAARARRRLVMEEPASFVAFDVPASPVGVAGRELAPLSELGSLQ